MFFFRFVFLESVNYRSDNFKKLRICCPKTLFKCLALIWEVFKVSNDQVHTCRLKKGVKKIFYIAPLINHMNRYSVATRWKVEINIEILTCYLLLLLVWIYDKACFISPHQAYCRSQERIFFLLNRGNRDKKAEIWLNILTGRKGQLRYSIPNERVFANFSTCTSIIRN